MDSYLLILFIFRLPLNTQFLLLRDNVPKIVQFLSLAYNTSYKPKKIPVCLEQFLYEEDQRKNPNDLTVAHFNYDMTRPPKNWYRSEEHRQQCDKAIFDLMDCNFTEESFTLLLLICLFHQENEDNDLMVKNASTFFKELLHKYFMSTRGAIYGKHCFEKYLEKLENIFKIEDLLFQ